MRLSHVMCQLSDIIIIIMIYDDLNELKLINQLWDQEQTAEYEMLQSLSLLCKNKMKQTKDAAGASGYLSI